MSLDNWLKNARLDVRAPSSPILPDPRNIECDVDAQTTTAANDVVENVINVDEGNPTSGKKRKRGDYGTYSPETRAKIARYAIDNGPAKTARHFSNVLGTPINESTVRSIKASYNKTPGKVQKSLPRSPRGRPVKMGLYDRMIQSYIRRLRNSACVVNTPIVMAGARGIIYHQNKSVLKEHGGHLEITKDWAKSIMRRMGFSKRKGTKGVKKLPDDFQTLKKTFNDRVSKIVNDDNIPNELIINWDQTGVNLVPCGNWTMEQSGSKQVPILGVDDKRQITALLGITKSGKVLPPQLIYQGKTQQCHPDHSFPEGWNITHSESHWSTGETMIEYVKSVIIPYVDKVKDDLDLPLNQKAICIFDVYKAHRGDDLLNLLNRHRIRVAFVPAACTDKLQPLDLMPNNLFKSYMKSKFQDYYASEVERQLSEKKDLVDVDIDLRLSTIKPKHAQWIVSALCDLQEKRPVIIKSFEQAGL